MASKQFTQLQSLLMEKYKSQFDDKQAKTFSKMLTELKPQIVEVFGNGRKKTKDPNAPKKPRSSYIFFCEDNRPSVKSKNPTLSNTEILTSLGAEWKKLSDAKKEKYKGLADTDKKRYEKEISSYVPSEAPLEKSSETATDKPKRAKTAYMIFSDRTREQIKQEDSKLSSKEIMSEISVRWKKLSDEEKKAFSTETASATPVKVTPVKVTPVKVTPVKVTPVKQEKATPVKQEKVTPVKATPTKVTPVKQEKTHKHVDTPGFTTFCDEFRDDVEGENKEWNATQVNAQLRKQWASLTSTEREEYEEEGKEEGESSGVNDDEDD